MSSHQLKIDKRVKVVGKDVQGTIAFIGPTSFAADTWIGLKLDEPKGKNNGSVQGVEYFKVGTTKSITAIRYLHRLNCYSVMINTDFL